MKTMLGRALPLVALALAATLATGCGGDFPPGATTRGSGGSSSGGSSSGGSSSGGSSSTGSSSSSSGSNVQTITAGAGPTEAYFNGLFTDVTVCSPGSTNCQTVSGVLVDTGSYGLRIVSSALPASLSLSPQTSGNNPVAECADFLSGKTWGPVEVADVQLAGEKASSVPIQIINSAYANSTICGDQAELTLLQDLGVNGILGIGNFLQDCGDACAPGTTENPGLYFSCPGSSACAITTLAVDQQVQNPVALFSPDNNGVIIQLPGITSADGGAASLTGSLIFGIGTQSNNQLASSATTLALDKFGNLSTIFNGQTYDQSFLDSGSNAIFFLSSAILGSTTMPVCAAPNTDFSCPPSPVNLSAENQGANGAITSVSFAVSAAFVSGGLPVYDNVAGPFITGAGGTAPQFDWGLPFFVGRTVYAAFEGNSLAQYGYVAY